MKKIIVLFLLISSSIYALDCSIEIGVQDKILIVEDVVFDDFGEYFIEIQLWQDIGIFNIHGSYRNEMNSTDSWMFNPVQDYFTVELDVIITDELIFSLSHGCEHIVENKGIEPVGIFGGFTQISFKYSSGD